MKKRQFAAGLLSLCLFLSCQKEEIPMLSLGLDDAYILARMQTQWLRPAFEGAAYRWTMKTGDGRDSLVSTRREYIFLAADTGVYHLTFEIQDPANAVRHDMVFYVMEEEIAYSPYIYKVYEFRPAPGQFVNKLPLYEKGDTEAAMIQKVQDCIGGVNDVLVSLGAYGGYVTFGFDHTVINVPGELDIKIFGGAFYAATVPTPGVKESSGSCEPGIVMVSFDENQNGLPDDRWYELAGSEYRKPETVKDYEITYYRPDPGKAPAPDHEYVYYTDTTYIKWTSNQGDYGYVIKNSFHSQSYYPQWLDESAMTFRGTKLADNYIDAGGNGSYYVQFPYEWGYVDNHPNEVSADGRNLSSFDIDWAVDEQGNSVRLRGVDFVRVYTGVNQYCGWLGETSTEISKAQDLHIDVKPTKP